MGDGEFVSVKKLHPCEFTARDVMAVAMHDLVVAVARSANDLELFDIASVSRRSLARRTRVTGITITCIDVNLKSDYVVTGGVSDTGAGELAIWQISSGHEIAVLSVTNGVTHVQFGSSPTEIVFADVFGHVAVATLLNFFIRVQLRLKSRFEHDIGDVLTGIRMFGGLLYVFTHAGTYTLDISREGLPHRDVNTRQALSFAFLARDSVSIMAQCMGHDVLVSRLDGTGEVRVVSFEKTPAQVAVVDADTVAAMFPGRIEVVGPGVQFSADVPRGVPLADDGSMCIVGDFVYRIKVRSRQKRIQKYVEGERWDLAFRQISCVDDVPDFYGLVNSYIQSSNFDAAVLFDVLERLDVTDYVVTGMLSEKRVEILEALVRSGRHGWVLKHEFVCELLRVCQDEKSVTEFFKSVELNIMWIGDIVVASLRKGWYDLAAYVVTTYMHDCYLQYLLACYKGDFEKVHNIMDMLLENPSEDLVTGTFHFMENQELSGVIAHNENHICKVVSTLLETVQVNTWPLIRNVIKAISKDSGIWLPIAAHMIQKRIIVDDSVVPYIENFLFFKAEPVPHLQSNLLLMLLETNQFTNLKKYLDLSRCKCYVECELWIVGHLSDPSELLPTLVVNKLHTFKDLLATLPNVKSLLIDNAPLFLSINSDEFCDSIAELCDMNEIRKINDLLSPDSAALWHFQKRIFTRKEFAAQASPSEVIHFTEQMCTYMKDQVLSTLRLFNDIPTTKVLSICETYGVVNATLYLCDMMKDFTRAKEFAKRVITRSLMQDQSSQTVTQVCEYLSTSSCRDGKIELWLDIMESFRLPLYAFKNDSEKLSHVSEILGQFMDAMVRDVSDPQIVSRRFTKSFGFLPFKTARPILARFFRSVREKCEFMQTLNDILKCEAVEKQMAHVIGLSSGRVYHAVHCAGCNRRLGQGTVVGARCGHVFHIDCVRNGWCPICDTSFHVPENTTRRNATPRFWDENAITPQGPPNPREAPRLGTVSVC